jgi:hypothetical protein
MPGERGEVRLGQRQVAAQHARERGGIGQRHLDPQVEAASGGRPSWWRWRLTGWAL